MTVTNVSGYALSPLQIHNALVGVLNNGTLVPGSIVSSTGDASISGGTLVWEGALADNASVDHHLQDPGRLERGRPEPGRRDQHHRRQHRLRAPARPPRRAAERRVSQATLPRPPHHHCKWGWDKKKEHRYWPRPHKPVKPFPIDPVGHEVEAEEEEEGRRARRGPSPPPQGPPPPSTSGTTGTATQALGPVTTWARGIAVTTTAAGAEWGWKPHRSPEVREDRQEGQGQRRGRRGPAAP